VGVDIQPVATLTDVLECERRFEGIPIAHGNFGVVVRQQGEWIATGWMLLPDQPFDTLVGYWNGERAAVTEPAPSPDVSKAFPTIAHAGRSRFSMPLPDAFADSPPIGHLAVIGEVGGAPAARMTTVVRADIGSAVPVPPAQLIERVVGMPNAPYFLTSGLKSFTEFALSINRHRELSSLHRVLDWGCGCGRVSVHFLQLLDAPGLEWHGCDIDGEAVTWCAEHLQPGRFVRVDPWPPTGFADGMFDVVIGFSVCTHLQRAAQAAWLAEIRRIIAPGGLFLTSTHGDYVAHFAPRDRAAELLRQGISDDTPDRRCDGIAPPGYYRGVFQTRDYTVREWSKSFEILDYIERGMGNYQDLVVMRRPR